MAWATDPLTLFAIGAAAAGIGATARPLLRRVGRFFDRWDFEHPPLLSLTPPSMAGWWLRTALFDIDVLLLAAICLVIA